MNTAIAPKLEVINPEDSKIEIEAAKNEGILKLEAAQMLARTIKDDLSYNAAVQFRMDLKKHQKAIVERLDKIRRPAYEAYQAILKLIKEASDPIDQAVAALDGPIVAYHNERERKRKEEEARAQAEAQSLQEDTQQAQALEAEKSGDHDRAAAIIEQPIMPAPVVALKAPGVSGHSIRDNYKAEVYDFRALVAAIAAGNVPITMIQPNEFALNSMAKTLKQEMKFPGVRVVNQPVVSSRTK